MTKKLLFFICLFINIKCFAQNQSELQLYEQDLKNISTQRIYDYDNSDDYNDEQYIKSVYTKEKEFFEKLTKTHYKLDFEGNWILVDSQLQSVSKKSSYYNTNSFSIERINNYIEYRYTYTSGIIYTNEIDFYFHPSVHSWIIKKIKIEDDKLYLYILENDKWILDPIHEGGKLFYIKSE